MCEHVPDIAPQSHHLAEESVAPSGGLPARAEEDWLAEAVDAAVCPTVPADVECFSLDVGQCLMPCSHEMFDNLVRPQPFASLHPPPCDVPDAPRFADWILHAAVGRSPGPQEAVVITTDGSFVPATGQAGWALVVSLACPDEPLPGRFVGCCYGPLQAFQIGAGVPLEPFDPYLAELAGLFWAAVLALRLPVRTDIYMRADNAAALQGAEGACQLKPHLLGTAVNCVHTALRLLRTRVIYRHVPGHRGEQANELADGLAALGARGRHASDPLTLDLGPWFAQQAAAWKWLPHLCLVRSQPETMPPTQQNVMTWDLTPPRARMSGEEIMAPFTRTMAVASDGRRAPCVFSFVCVTFNALSLLDPHREDCGQAGGLYGAAGRTAILAESLRVHGVFLAGVQEARTPKGTVPSALFVRYCSGCTERKSHGVEVWVAQGGRWPEHRAVILHATHTRLILRLTFLGQCVLVLSGHAPHRAAPPNERAQWWDETTRICTCVGADHPWILLVDANARVGSVESEHIGGFQADVEDDGGGHMHGLLQTLRAWVPATFSGHMTGPGGTLLQKLSCELHRSDYVCLPMSWRHCSAEAWVEPAISSGHAIMDHLASAVQVTLSLETTAPRQRCARIDREAILDPANRASLEAILASAPRVAWGVNVNDHAALLVGYLHRELLAAFPLRRSRMRQPFFSGDTGVLHQAIATMRKALRNRMAALRLARLRCVLLAWRPDGPCFEELYTGNWLRHLQLNIGLLTERLSGLGRELRRSCRSDKRAHLENLAKQANEAGPAQIHDAVKKLLRPKKYRRQGPAPLPQIRRKDNSLCQSSDDILDRWREHFSDLEGGFSMTPATLASRGLAWQAATPAAESLLAEEMPDFCGVLAAFRGINPRRAAGQDCLPPAICRAFASQMSVLVWPLLLKSLAYNAEPLGLKGGVLFHIDKASANDKLSCQSQRGILAQSAIEKVLHKSLRKLVLRELARHTDGLHLGGRPGASFVFGSFCSRTFLDYARQAGISASILFTDLVAAYYAVVREAVMGDGVSPLPLSRVMQSLGMTEADVQELQHYIADSPVLQTGQCSELLRCVAREFHSFTWFLLQGDSKIVWTTRGTRPGGCLADVIFSLLFIRVLRRRGAFRDRGWCPLLKWSGLRCPHAFDPRIHTTCEIESQDIVYADDLATCIVAGTVEELPAATAHVAGVTIDTLSSHGLAANVGPRKTAALLCPVGPGAKRVREQVFTRGRGRLTVLCETSPAVTLDAVASYKHLGSTVAFSGSLIPEVRTKMGLARGAFKEGKRLIFCARHLDLDKRVTLFRSHVLSIVLTGAGSWPSLCQTSWRLYEKGLFALFRQLLRVPRSAPQQISRPRILARLGLPSPLDLLQGERLRFLGQLARSGPDQAWALLQGSPRALQAFWDAGDWLLQALGNTSTLGSMRDNWDAWRVVMCEQPGRWKGLIKRATEWHRGQHCAEADVQDCLRLCWPQLASARCVFRDVEHACVPCKIAFADFQAWAAHAAKTHKYRSRARRYARGVRCQACGAVFAQHIRLVRHLQHSERCCQAVAQGTMDLLPVLDVPDGPAQAGWTPGDNWGRVPAVGVDISAELLSRLRSASLEDDCQIFDLVAGVCEPFPMLRNTLDAWIQELPEGRLRVQAQDVALCWDVSLLCDTASAAPSTDPDDGIIEEDLDFHPDLRILPSVLLTVGTGLAVAGFRPASSALSSRCAEWSHCDFGIASLDLASFVALGILVPAPPCACLPFWRVPSCTLRQQRAHREWLQSALTWISAAIAFARTGRPCSLGFVLPRATGGQLFEWLEQTALWAGVSSPLSVSFTD